MKTNVLLHNSYGKPEDVVRLTTYEIEDLAEGQVLVDMAFSPINPADLNMLEGTYYTQPELPAVLGNEGVGVVEAVAEGVTSVKVGDHVIFPFRGKDNWVGLWAEKVVSPANELVIVPSEISLQQAAMLTVNPATAYQLLTLFDDLSSGDVVIQNAGNSSVGRWVISIAKSMGVKTISLVRNVELIDDLKALGADWVFVDDEDVVKKIKEASSDSRLAFNAVGGQSATHVMKGLVSDGILVTYGAMSKEPVQVSSGALIYKNIWVTGFNRAKWVAENPKEVVLDVYKKLIDFILKHKIEIPVEATYSFSDVDKAIAHASQSGRTGKVLFEI